MKDILNNNCATIVAGIVVIVISVLVFVAFLQVNNEHYTAMRHCLEIGGTWTTNFNNVGNERICQIMRTQ
jgi:hypothetical protein